MTSSTQPYPFSNSSSANTSQTPGLEVWQEEESFNKRQVINAARRRAWLILIVAIAVTGGIWTRTLSQPPRYRSSFQLLVEPIAGDQKFQQLSQQLDVSSNSNPSQDSGLDYPTQIHVLKSSQVMRPIYEQLKKDYPELTYGQLVGQLSVNRLGETKVLQVSYESEDPQLAGAVTKTVAEEYIDYSEQQQKKAEQRVLDLIEAELPSLQQKVDSIQAEIEKFRNEHNVVNPIETGNQLSSNITDLEQRQRETQIQIEEKLSLRENLLKQLGLELDEAMTTVALSEAPRYQELLNQLKEIETKIALESARFTKDSPNIEALQQQKERILQLLQEEASAVLGKEQTDGEMPSAISSPNPIRLSLTQDLISATNEIRVLKVRKSALEDAEQELRQEITRMTELAREYEGINQRLQIAEQNLQRFIDRREQLKIQSVQKSIPWQLLESPYQPNQPLSSKTQGLILGVIAGALAGAGAAFLVEKIDNKFHIPDDLKEMTNLATLGVIPFHRELQALPEATSPKSNSKAQGEQSNQSNHDNGQLSTPLSTIFMSSFPFAEAFRSLHTNLSFMNPDQPIKSLVISSCIPGEGKSTVALNLAQVAASVGKRVLLIDADLRLPQIHQTLELSNQYGLSNIISGEVSSEEAIQQSSLNNNLYVITSGATPPDPTRLLSSNSMKQLAQQWEDSFDLVLYDSPPLGGLADARLLTPLTNGLILVVGLGVTNRSIFKDVIDLLKVSQARVLGTVANGIKQGSVSDYYYHYTRYYSYYNNYTTDSHQASLASSNNNNRNQSS